MDELASFGAALRRWRKARDLSQAELAARSGCAEDTIRKLEADARRPSRQLAERLADELALAADARRAFVQAARGILAGERLELPPSPATSEVAAAMPGGTLTFLFSDIEGSTPLWEQHPQAMSQALARHDAILRQAVVCQHGTVFKTVGDSIHAVFARAADALTAALTAQRALLAEAWEASGLPEGQPLRARMALHTGVADARDGDYFGPAVNRLARLLAAAHGGQILLSSASAELVADGLPQGVSVRDLGRHQLKGLERPEQIFQLLGPGLPCEFPPLRSVAPPATNAPALAIALLTTKLYVPPPRSNLVTRPRLTARLQAGMTGKLTLLSAPAGCGKTTLLAQACGARGAELGELPAPPSAQRPSTWVSLDAGDNDPPRFWSYICAALDALMPGVAETALVLLQSSQPPPAETVLPSLLNALSARAAECVLVLDDYHVIDAAAIHAGLTFLLDHLPPTLHLVIASRADPPLPLSRLRACGELTELRATELHFTPDEAASFLTEVMGLPLTSEEVAALERRTEGWIAGLQLAALSMRERRDLAGFIRAFTGSNQFVGEYLADEVFARQPAHIQTFLLQTSILDRMCGSLCDAVMLGGAGTVPLAPHPGAPIDSFSQVLLECLERANVFVVPLDEERRWYRYHHLFGEMLRARLLRGASEAAIATLHQRASAWYEQQGLVMEAVQHALAAHDWERAARQIEAHGLLLLQSGQVHTVLGWLYALPVMVVQLSPTLCLVHAVGLLFTNQVAAAEGRLQDAERALQPEMPDDLRRLVRGRVALVRGHIRYLAGDLAQTISLLQQALEILPEPTTSVAAAAAIATARAIAAMFTAMTYQLTGDVTEASERRAADALARMRAMGHVTATLLSGYISLAGMQALQGRLRAAAATYAEVERLVPGPDALHALVSSPAYYVGMADLLYEWNQLDAAETYLARGMELVHGGLATGADVIVRGYRALAWVQQAHGHSAEALATLAAFLQLAHERQFVPLLLEQAAALQAQLQQLQGDVPSALRWAEASGLSPDDISFPHEVAHLTLARVRIVAGQAAAVVPLLDRLLADAEAKARMHSAIEILMLQALAYQALEDRPRAVSALHRALTLAEPEGYIRTFVDEGAPMRGLLAAYSGQLTARVRTGGEPSAARLLAYVETLLAAFPIPDKVTRWQGGKVTDDLLTPSPAHPLTPSLIEPLSERELEVLTLIAEGHSNQQIAAALIVSVGTVKKHLNNIFGKLGVESRTQAVARARALHLM